MSSQSIRWIVILVALALAALNPIYRHYNLDQPIVTLGLDLRGGVEVLLQAKPDPNAPGGLTEVTPEQLAGARAVIENRVDPQGTKELILTQVGEDRLLLQVPGERNPQEIIRIIGDTALLEFVNTGADYFESGTSFAEVGSSQRLPDFAKYETILTGADLARSDVQMQAGKPIVGFTFRGEAADIFGHFTANHVGQHLTVLLDGVVLTSPEIRGPIWGGEGIIEGTFSVEEATRIVRQLNAGALPVPLEILSHSIVSPTLGQSSIDSTFMAGMIGIALALLFMMLFYRLPGLIASVSLMMYVVLVLGLLSLFNVTLTLPGIAGFLLSVGMAIDANIIIFERLKEELRWGKTLVAALDSAFARAWVAILDGQLTTLLGAAVLYFLGTGPVKGFAVTLFIGNLMALFSGVFITRTMLSGAVRHFPRVSLYAPRLKQMEGPAELLRSGRYIHFVERTALWVSLSLLAISVGVVFMFMNYSAQVQAGSDRPSPFNLGIDYTGGEMLIMRMTEPLPSDGQEVAAIVAKYSDGTPVVQVDAADNHVVSIRMRVAETGDSAAARSQSRADSILAMQREVGDAFGGYSESAEAPNPQIGEQNYVGPTVGGELINKAIWALVIGSLLIMAFIFMRFGEMAYSLAAIVALIHDVLVTLAVAAIFRLEVNASFIAVILTIIGYSINDTIIIFDRVRENRRHLGDGASLAQLANLSLTQTLMRSLYTGLTVVFFVVTILIFGGPNLQSFMAAMLAGLISGAYSSLYIATPLWLWLHRKFAARPPADGTPVLATAGAGGGGGTPVVEVTPETEGAVEAEARRQSERKRTGKPQQRRR